LSHHCTPRSARQSHRFRLTARYSIFSDICLIHHHLACSLRMRLNVAGHALGTSLWLRRLSTDGVVDSRVPRTCYRWEQTVSSRRSPSLESAKLIPPKTYRQNPTEISNFGIQGLPRWASQLHFTLQTPFGQCHVSQLWEKPCRSQSSKESFPSFALHYCRLLPVGVVLRLFRPRPHVSWHLISSSSLSGEVRE
jgi:hypothetical protein